MSIDGEMNVNV